MDPQAERRARSRARVTQALAARLGWEAFGAAGFPADVARVLREHRALGSRDRRFQREALFLLARFLPWWRGVAADDLPRCAALAAELTDTAAPGDTPEPERVRAVLDRAFPGRVAEPASLLPAWLRDEAPACFEEGRPELLATRPPVWLRARPGRREAVLQELDLLGFHPVASAVVADALRIDAGRDVTTTNAFALGRVEVQDLGSQLLLAHVAVAPGGRWLDACAGAGGKTLQLADLVGPGGRVDAADIRPAALHELRARRTRAGLGNIGVHVWRPDGGADRLDAPGDLPAGAAFDGVLVDAPCSGTGTWRRNPHLRWVVGPGDIARHAARQLALLRAHAGRVRPGGLLVYATCSLCRSENEAVVRAFLEGDPAFRAEEPAPRAGCERTGVGVRIPPWAHDNDGFFLGVLRRAS